MELRHLRYFVAVAEELHFGRAAARLHISQPPLSQQIKALEGEVGVELFHRTRRTVSLTDAGKAFLPAARATLDQAQRAETLARDVAAGRQGRLAVAFVTSASYSILPDAIRGFRSAFPGVDLTLREMIPSDQIQALTRQEVDVGLLRPPLKERGIIARTVLEEPLVAALPVDHVLAKRPSVLLEQLRSEDWVLFPRRHGPGLFDTIAAACRAAGFSPQVRHEPNDMQSVLAHVAAGLGVSLLPSSLMGFHPRHIAYRSLHHRAPCIQLVLALPAARPSILSREFLTCCLDAAKAYRKDAPTPTRTSKGRGTRASS